MKKSIDKIAAKSMMALWEYDWRGNIRELENFIERAVILSRGPELELPLSELVERKRSEAMIAAKDATTLEEAEREHILRTLKDTKSVIA